MIAIEALRCTLTFPTNDADEQVPVELDGIDLAQEFVGSKLTEEGCGVNGIAIDLDSACANDVYHALLVFDYAPRVVKGTLSVAEKPPPASVT